MSSIAIADLAHSAELDNRAMSVVRGGSGFGQDVNVNVNLKQQIGQFQQIGINVLNGNGVIGAGFKGPEIDLDAVLRAENNVLL
ncbi:hypothetical protein [Massilia sp. Leaf139]|uniref:hypothetical protein n=1 Tax=Massilia sp. Leaf139 TaxID=1736272 RepID=UPI0006F9E967|nr:hypothetical protein [Massilia sp. Leaf139]KQQ97189.1 hypothetical protein ASF77_04310 [Massilia sp. Leaf139]